MNYQIEPISGNSFLVKLFAVTAAEKAELSGNNEKLLGEHFREAVRQKFGNGVRLASLTPDPRFPYCATIELFSQSGSV